MRQITFRLAVALFVLSLGVGFAQAQMQYGIDVSRFQGAINWTAVRSSGISFAFAKATEGIDFVDVRFTQNMAGATAAGVYIGPYHFARPDSYNTDPSDAASEANDFVDAILPYYQGSPYTLRPVIDLERLANVGDLAQEKAFLSQWIRNFATVVRTRLGFDPIIYTSPSYANYVLDSDINQYVRCGLHRGRTIRTARRHRVIQGSGITGRFGSIRALGVFLVSLGTSISTSLRGRSRSWRNSLRVFLSQACSRWRSWHSLVCCLGDADRIDHDKPRIVRGFSVSSCAI